MLRIVKLSLVATLGLLSFVPLASARPRVIVRGYFGPGFYGPAYYGPTWYGPWWGGAYGGGAYGYEHTPTVGSVKFETKAKDAAVYVDGGYAGTVGELKTFQLRPGNHNVELRDRGGNAFFQDQITVVAGKTVKLRP